MTSLLLSILLIAAEEEKFIELHPADIKSVVFLASNPEDEFANQTAGKVAEMLTDEASYLTIVLGSCSPIWKENVPAVTDSNYTIGINNWLRDNNYNIAIVFGSRKCGDITCFRGLIFNPFDKPSYVDVNVQAGWTDVLNRFEEAIEHGGLPWQTPQDMALVPSSVNNAYSYLIDRYEFPNEMGQYPRVLLSWYQAQKACEEKGKRLCTANEWVNACRGSTSTMYPYGSDFEADKCHINVGKDTGLKKIGKISTCRSDYGVYDMIGNVKEWVIGEEGKSGSFQPILGGAWYYKELVNCIGPRSKLDPRFSFADLGFRCCK
jgi:hypothetical protein